MRFASFRHHASRHSLLAALLLAVGLAPAGVRAQAAAAQDCTVPAGDVLRIMLSGPMNVAKLQPGTRLEGALMRPVFVVDRQALPAGTRVEVVVEKVKKERLGAKRQGFFGHLESLSSPGAKYGYHMDFRSAALIEPSGQPIPIQVSYVEAGEVVRLHTKGEELQLGGNSAKELSGALPGVGRVQAVERGHHQWEEYRHPILAVQLDQPVAVPAPAAAPAAPSATTLSGPVTLPSGTHARLLLLSELSASGSHEGESFQARLLEPVRSADGHLVLPEGSVFDGHISKLVRPRRLSRAGSMHLAFDRIRLGQGAGQTVLADKVAASLAATELDNQSHVKMDEEGSLHGADRTKKQFAEDFGLGLGMNQVVDEAMEMAVRAAAPYAGAATGLLFLFGRHGKDVDLPKYTEMEVVFNRPLTVPGAPAEPAGQPGTAPAPTPAATPASEKPAATPPAAESKPN